MKKNFTILAGICAAALMLVGTATAAPTPYPLQFDPDAAGAFYSPATIWGWDLEAVAKETVASGLAIDIVTHQQLGADGFLNNGDVFTENLTVAVLAGLGAPPSYAGPAAGGPTPSYTGFPPFVPSANLYIDIDLTGFIDNVSGPSDTSATNYPQIALNSFDSVFTGGSGTMYVDANANFAYDLGETVVATFGLVNAGSFTVVDSVFSQGGSASMSFGFGTTSVNTDYFGNAPGFPNFLDAVNQGWHLTVTQGNVAFAGELAGNTASDPDEILLGWQETGFDAKFTVVPEPSTILLLGCGLIGVAVVGKKRFAQK